MVRVKHSTMCYVTLRVTLRGRWKKSSDPHYVYPKSKSSALSSITPKLHPDCGIKSQRMYVKDTDKGKVLRTKVENLKRLLFAYRNGFIKEIK